MSVHQLNWKLYGFVYFLFQRTMLLQSNLSLKPKLHSRIFLGSVWNESSRGKKLMIRSNPIDFKTQHQLNYPTSLLRKLCMYKLFLQDITSRHSLRKPTASQYKAQSTKTKQVIKVVFHKSSMINHQNAQPIKTEWIVQLFAFLKKIT